jgi:SAM-dependent methyltransferase
VGLAAHFDEVAATDGSDAQLALAEPHPRVRYSRALADASGLPDGWASLVTVAQALHWFDLAAFYAEARRVLRPGGLLAVWNYNLMEIEPALDGPIQAFYRDTVGPYWPGERRIVEEGYRNLPFPFDEVPVPPQRMEAEWTLGEVARYLGTWSATLRYRDARGHDPVETLVAGLAEIWGAPETKRTVRWPLEVRAGTATDPGGPA